MSKHFFILVFLMSAFLLSTGQVSKQEYPIPDYSKEIYLLIRDSSSLMRLEKGSSKQEMKVKMMGMGGMDQGYSLDDARSPVRIAGGSNLVFIIYTGEPGTTSGSSAQSDSIMRANGMDPSLMSGSMSAYMDPTQQISLYNMSVDKGKRKILLQSMGIMGKSKKTSTKYTLSTKKVKPDYYEIIVDKPLPRGEYAFVMMSMSGDQSYSLFAFGID